MSTIQLSEALQGRYGARVSQRQKCNEASIEDTVSTVTNNTSIELPQEIDDLIDNKMYRNKFKKLVREGHTRDLLELAAIARTKDKPSHWFARATKTTAAPGQEGTPTNWERALKYLAKLRQVAQTAERVAKRIGTKVNSFIYKQIWKGVNVERWAITAEEVKHDKPGQGRAKHFAWLCINERQLAAETVKY
ncbi:MAG TPA: hypothetical protein VH599_07245 [Ktedonobacterales bacterium]|jgi:hypothetical protein